jgi:hypothetical protein
LVSIRAPLWFDPFLLAMVRSYNNTSFERPA